MLHDAFTSRFLCLFQEVVPPSLLRAAHVNVGVHQNIPFAEGW